MKIRNILFWAIALIILASCEPNEPDSVYVNTAPVINAQSFIAKENIADNYVIGTVTAKDEVDHDNITFSIKSDDSGLFEITPEGKISLIEGMHLNFKTAQKHTITVRAYDGIVGRSAEVNITVKDVEDYPPLEVVLDPTSLTLYPYPFYATQLQVTSDLEGNTVTWSSSDKSVAKVDENGLVTPVSVGNAIISAQAGGGSAQCTVEVIDGPVTELGIDLTDIELYTNESAALSIATLTADVEQTSEPQWSSDNANVATVGQNGIVTATGSGTANITVTVDNLTASCTVTVKPNVYVAGRKYIGQLFLTVAMVWVNGVPMSMSEAPNNTSAFSVFVQGTDIYVAGHAESSLNQEFTARLWKNGVPQFLGGVDDNTFSASSASSVYVDGDNVYVAGYVTDQNGFIDAALWENGTLHKLTNAMGTAVASSVFVQNNEVYVAGRISDSAALWKNQSLIESFGGNPSSASSIFVEDNTVYVAGSETFGNSTKAIQWENGSPTVLTTDENLSGATGNSIFVDNGNVYVSGSEINGGGILKLWTNGKLTNQFTDGSEGGASIGQVFVDNGNVYVVGSISINNNLEAKLWVNGQLLDFFDDPTNASASAVFVK